MCVFFFWVGCTVCSKGRPPQFEWRKDGRVHKKGDANRRKNERYVERRVKGGIGSRSKMEREKRDGRKGGRKERRKEGRGGSKR